MNRRNILIFLFVLLTSFGCYLRFFQLNSTPASLSYDELDNVVNGLSIFYTGQDLQGQHHIWDLAPVQTHTYTGELSALWHISPLLPLPLLISAKFPNGIAGIIAVVSLTWFAHLLFKKRSITLFTFLFFLFSPWHILISRTAYEAPIALALLLGSLSTFWFGMEEKNVRLKLFSLAGSLICMLLCFYTYHGYKFVLPFLYIILFFWQQKSWRHIKKHSFTMLTVFLIVWLIAFAIFGIRVKAGDYGVRSSEIVFLNSSSIASDVNMQRQLLFDNPLNTLFVNKITVISDKLVTSFFLSLDPVVLFVSGYDKGSLIGLWQFGFLYIFQLPLLFIGFIWLYRRYRRSAIAITILLIISLIPTVIHEGTSIVLRSNVFLPLLILVSAIGFAVLFDAKYKYKTIFVTASCIVALFNIIAFQQFYFNQYPIQTADAFFFKDRLLAEYIQRANQSHKTITVFADEPFNTMRIIAYYDSLINASTIPTWQTVLRDPKKPTYTFNNLMVTSECPKASMSNKNDLLIASPNHIKHCSFDKQYATASAILRNDIVELSSPKDNQLYYRVYKDSLCNRDAMKLYIHITQNGLFDLQSLSNEDFCRNWMKKEAIIRS